MEACQNLRNKEPRPSNNGSTIQIKILYEYFFDFFFLGAYIL